MCLNPINIVNRSKFLSREYRQPYFMQVRCGKCVECQKQNSMEWHYRSYHHFKAAIEGKQYVLFDTLTYDNKHLPHLSDFIELPVESLDFPCFSYQDIRHWLVRLRKQLRNRGYKDNFTYFLASEYGHDNLYVDDKGRQRRGTCRPHYHVLFFVSSDIPIDTMSELISRTWQKGKTDGYPYKSMSYVKNHNLIQGNTERSLRVTRYVSKYVMKSCAFTDEINKRVNLVVGAEAFNHDEGWLDSYDGRKYRNDLLRLVGQFHRQSKGFGLSALKGIAFGVPIVTMPDLDKVVASIPLPMYYKRKLYQYQVDIDGQKFWTWNDDGVRFLQKRESETIDLLAKRLMSIVATYKVPTTILGNNTLHDVANYMVTERGFFTRSKEIASLATKLDSPLLFNYVTHCDDVQFGKKFLSYDYYGVKDAYLPLEDNKHLLDIDKMRQLCYFDDRFEIFIKSVYDSMVESNLNKTLLERHRERLRNILLKT